MNILHQSMESTTDGEGVPHAVVNAKILMTKEEYQEYFSKLNASWEVEVTISYEKKK